MRRHIHLDAPGGVAGDMFQAAMLDALPFSPIGAGGQTALHAALTSCAPGVMVVNIDNGFGAAAAAVKILKVAAQR